MNEYLYSFEINMYFFPLFEYSFCFALCVSFVIKNQMYLYVFASKFKIDKDEFVSPHLELGGPFSHHKRAVLFNQER